jgi:hypothetical protein
LFIAVFMIGLLGVFAVCFAIMVTVEVLGVLFEILSGTFRDEP